MRNDGIFVVFTPGADALLVAVPCFSRSNRTWFSQRCSANWSFLCSKVNQFWWLFPWFFHHNMFFPCFFPWFFHLATWEGHRKIPWAIEDSFAPGAGVVVANVSAMTVHRLMESFPQLVGHVAPGRQGLSWATKDWWFTLWLCQNSYWKWPFIVDLPIKNGDFPVRYVSLPEGTWWFILVSSHWFFYFRTLQFSSEMHQAVCKQWKS